MSKRRISLGLKQTIPNPWEDFLNKHPAGSEVEGEIKSITEFGLFLGFDNDVDGLVHLSDISWDKPDEEAATDYKKADDNIHFIVYNRSTGKVLKSINYTPVNFQ